MKKIIILLLALSCLIGGAGCGRKLNKVSDTGFYLDTVVTVTMYGVSESVLNQLFDEIERLEGVFSVSQTTSEVSRINNGNGAVPVSDEMTEVINKALEISALTDGAFDITMEPLISLWNITGGGPVPAENDILSAKQKVGYGKIRLNDGFIDADDIQINLGGIAKGYIADRLCEMAKSAGAEYGIINLGGNVVVFGGNPDGGDYTIGIRDPFGDEDDIIGVVSLSDGSVVTSGSYERYFEQDGKKHHHILDPQTGYPAESGLCGVTILSKSSIDGDALSTAVFVMGAEKGVKFIENLPDVECLMITENGEILLSSGMKKNFTAY